MIKISKYFKITILIVFMVIFISCNDNKKITPKYLGLEVMSSETNIKEINKTDLSKIDSNVYSAKINEEIIIVVYFYNPNNFEILSFNINGIKYQAFQFLDGSDSENIYIIYDVGEEAKDIDLFIDEIKYIDNLEIVNVDIYGEQEIKIKVNYSILPVVKINEEITTTSCFKIDFTIDNYSYFKNKDFVFKLFRNNEAIYIEKITSMNKRIEIDNLDNDNDYFYQIIGCFDLFSKDEHDNLLLYENDIYLKSYLLKEEYNVSQKEIEYDLQLQDAIITFVELLSDGIEITRSNKANGKFIGLDCNTNYQLEIHFYALNKDRVIIKNIKTKMYESEELSFITNVTDNEIEYEIIHSENIFNIVINLFENDKLINSKNDCVGKFYDLTNNTKYKIIISYDYIIGNNILNKTVKEYIVSTALKELEIVSFNKISQFEKDEGFIVRFRVDLKNELNFKVTKFFYLDNEYKIIITDNCSYAVLEIFINEYDIFDMYISKIVYESDEIEVNYKISTLLKVNISTEKSEFINDVYIKEEYFSYPNFILYVKTNKELQDIVSFKTVYRNNNKERNLISFEYNYLGDGLYEVIFFYNEDEAHYLSMRKIEEIIIEYSNKEITKKNLNIELLWLYSDVKKEINSIQELRNMKNGFIYTLNCDLDMKGIVWEPYTFYGVLEGNNHTIKGLTISKAIDEQNDSSLGLFSNFAGIIKNLKLLDIDYNIIDNNPFGEIGKISVGGLIGSSILTNNAYIYGENSIYLDNIELTGNIRLIANKTSCCSGMIGYMSANGKCKMNRIKTSLNIYCDNRESVSIGAGLLGYCQDLNGSLSITNSIVETTAEVTNKNKAIFAGVYCTYSSVEHSVCKCIVKANTKNINKEFDFICVTNMEINYANRGSKKAIIDSLSLNSSNKNNKSIFINSYYLEEVKENDYDFFKNTLKFDDSIWNITTSDIRNGILPSFGEIYEK